MNLRKANKDDIPYITNICRMSFGDSLKWFIKEEWSNKYWQEVIEKANLCQVDILEEDGVVGFILTVLNPRGFNDLKKKNKITLDVMVLSFLEAPLFFSRLILKRLFTKKINLELFEKKHSSTEEAECWIELIAVSPEERGRKLGSLMLQHHINSFSGSFSSTKLLVHSSNGGALELYKKFGFVRKK